MTKIGFDFDTVATPRGAKTKDSPEAWEQRYEDLVAFKDEHGNCRVPSVYDPNPALAKWVARQKTKYRNGSLSDEKLGKSQSQKSHLCIVY